MSVCSVFSCVVGRWYFLWQVHSLGKTLLTFGLLHSVLRGQICLLLQVFLDFLLFIPVPYNEKDLFWVLVLEGLVDLHRTIQLQVLHHYWSGHSLGIQWYWMVCLGNDQRSLCHFRDCIQVLHCGGSDVKVSACNAGDLRSILRLRISPREGNGNPLHYSCLENPMDGGPWGTTVHGVTKSRTRLSHFTFTVLWTLLLTMMVTSFILRDSCPQ